VSLIPAIRARIASRSMSSRVKLYMPLAQPGSRTVAAWLSDFWVGVPYVSEDTHEESAFSLASVSIMNRGLP
jgi:hypothetical protein